jgi:hypothetical protein
VDGVSIILVVVVIPLILVLGALSLLFRNAIFALPIAIGGSFAYLGGLTAVVTVIVQLIAWIAGPTTSAASIEPRK